MIHRISEFRTTIASAAGQQSATTSEMNRSVAGRRPVWRDRARHRRRGIDGHERRP
ncbi:hypothetical protein KIH74_09260 [Kineosporia sp. J2-2]|uniref:Uncharacterized protein n=1 Tax=Kineosporia corallincola TaxID=2835133 RepID=A0ABS5TFY9_9ACTN|nr:hypothetical protein [Kineosporia corallincola]MBT0769106.1 hypothetical protein [Kineosporia corallincola]